MSPPSGKSAVAQACCYKHVWLQVDELKNLGVRNFEIDCIALCANCSSGLPGPLQSRPPVCHVSDEASAVTVRLGGSAMADWSTVST